MILPYSYWYFQSVLSDDVCDKIIEHGLNKMYDNIDEFGQQSIIATTGDFREKGSPVRENGEILTSIGDMSSQEAKRKGIDLNNVYLRDSSIVFLEDQWLFELIWPFVHEANKSAGWNFEWDFTEDLQFTKYGINQFYGWHADSGPKPYEKYDPDKDEQLKDANGKPLFGLDGLPLPANSNLITTPGMIGKIRKISVTVSLSNPKNYKGGNLRFDFGPHSEGERYHLCKEIRPRGSIIVFPSHIYHQVTPVTWGTRYSLVAWCLGKPFR